MTNSTASIIREARQLITPPEAWTQGLFCRDKDGTSAKIFSDEAACFCLLGALRRITIGDFKSYYTAKETVEQQGASNASVFNDTHTHEEVLALLDKAALAAEDAA